MRETLVLRENSKENQVCVCLASSRDTGSLSRALQKKIATALSALERKALQNKKRRSATPTALR